MDQVSILPVSALPQRSEDNAEVCPKCSYHNRIGARARLVQLLDAEGQFEVGANIAANLIL